ncbi:transposase [Deinococcus grandis]|uniref:Transposase n=1 Tax=Deinococcus grandis TaxID=57498 RepID=A0A124BRR6_9DEIO|nr:hypothetical protein DEGR_12000 [Deinococcus grandis]GAQ22035.1 transposase [Deinococcus grandis]
MGGCELHEHPRGAETGPNTTDRDRPASKRHVIVNNEETPLAVRIPPANLPHSTLFEALLDAMPPIHNGRRGRTRSSPERLMRTKRKTFAGADTPGGTPASMC